MTMSRQTAVQTTIVFLLASSALLANSASFAGYIQASNVQDFAFLSSSVGDKDLQVTFSSAGAVQFAYFAGQSEQTATLRLVDNNIFEGRGTMNVMAGTMNITQPMDPGF